MSLLVCHSIQNNKKLVLATSAISETVVFFGEVITVSDDHSPAPHIYLPTHSQITILIKLLMDSSCLQEKTTE